MLCSLSFVPCRSFFDLCCVDRLLPTDHCPRAQALLLRKSLIRPLPSDRQVLARGLTLRQRAVVSYPHRRELTVGTYKSRIRRSVVMRSARLAPSRIVSLLLVLFSTLFAANVAAFADDEEGESYDEQARVVRIS